MIERLIRGLLAAAALVLLTAVLQAAVPTFWQVGTEAEFLKGEVENLSIDSYGRLTLGPASSSIYDASAPFLWAMIDGPDGSVYIGSGNEGQVYRVDSMGRGSVFFDAEELEVHALAAAPGGGLYVGTSPEGRIYKVDPAGKATTFFDPADKYIWSLAVDRAGNLFAATGDKGAVFYQTKATHAISLAFDRDGRLLVGTESPGRLFRIDASGKPFVLLDSPYNEIHAIRVDGAGTIYAAAVSGRTGSGGTGNPPAQMATDPAPPPIPSVSTEILSISIADVPATTGATTTQPARTTGPAAGALYRITPDGASDLVWESREDTPYVLAVVADGTVLVATGNKGKIFRLSGDPLQPTLIARANAQQVTTLLRDRAGRTLVATANPGKLLRLSTARADRGIYTSDVRDASSVAAWGTIKWQALPSGGRVEVSTRSGNTRTPDETWSDWSPAYADPQGSAITSPRARYLQWRATLVAARADSPLLTSVTAAYLPRNIRPKITSITINPPGTVFQRPFPTGEPEIAGFEGDTPDRRFAAQGSGQVAGGAPSLGRRAYQKGLLTFIWRAEDENKDDLTYDVLYRREGETAWRTLRKGLTDSIVVWDTTSVPNGRYLVRIAASDLPSNAQTSALVGTLDSSTFDIDNTPPTIAVTPPRREGARTILTFDVRDEDSSVQKAEYSLDGEQWQAIYPKDGIADSRAEHFELVMEGEMAVRGVIIRAADALNNIASARAEPPPAASNRR